MGFGDRYLFGSEDPAASSGSGAEQETETRMVKKTKEYTEHTADIQFSSGRLLEGVKFDSLKHKDDGITLKNYTGYTIHPSAFGGGSFDAEAIMFIGYENLEYIETTNREKKEIEYEKEVEVSGGDD